MLTRTCFRLLRARPKRQPLAPVRPELLGALCPAAATHPGRQLLLGLGHHEPQAWDCWGLRIAAMEWRSISKFARKQPPDFVKCWEPLDRPVVGEDVRINDRIFAPELRVVLPDGTHKIMRRVEALKLARFEQLDLVEVVPDVAPPVAKLMDFAKHVHAQRLGEKQIEKKIRLRAKLDSPKELRLSPKIADHDLEQKIQRMRDFLQKGQKVSVVVRFKGAAEERMAEEALNFVVATVSTEFRVTSETLPSTGRTKSVLLSPSPTADVGGRTTEQPVKQPVGTTAVQ